MEKWYRVYLKGGMTVRVCGYSVLDAENYAIEIYGNKFVSIEEVK